METRELGSWREFQSVVSEIRKVYGYYDYNNTILFRGQPNLPIKTTLERNTNKEFSLGSYLALVGTTVNEIETTTGVKRDIPDHPQLIEEIKKKQTSHRIYLPQTCYSYLVYLRHHGYPSPLLDWTISPYVAAYFAYCDAPREKSELRDGKCETIKDDKVAIYVYIDMVDNVKSIENPSITLFGQYVSTHKRHFAQKARYTIASKWSDEDQTHTFCSHHEIFDKTRKSYDPAQDILIKITLPTRDRFTALRELSEDYNINHYTLFQTEDSLVKTLSIRDFET